jgi:hypothetical protein
LTTLAVKAVVGVMGLLDLTLDPRDKGLIAGVTLILTLAGDALAAHFHINRKYK